MLTYNDITVIERLTMAAIEGWLIAFRTHLTTEAAAAIEGWRNAFRDRNSPHTYPVRRSKSTLFHHECHHARLHCSSPDGDSLVVTLGDSIGMPFAMGYCLFLECEHLMAQEMLTMV